MRGMSGDVAASGSRTVSAARIAASPMAWIVVAMPPASLDASLRRDDFAGALGVFLLVVLSTFPVVIPFMFVDELKLAMRLSNATGVVVLFVGGWMLARYAGGNPWKGGAAMAGVGAVLSAAIIALGG